MTRKTDRTSFPSNQWHRAILVLEPLEERTLLTGTWTALANLAPSPDGTSTMLLLSDGSVMVQGGTADLTKHIEERWYRLMPDPSGSYTDGTWSTLSSMNVARYAYGSSVLPDGRVFVVGGEYSSEGFVTPTSEIYNPVTDTWTATADYPDMPGYGDGPVEVLPNGTVLGCGWASRRAYIYDPATDAWMQSGTRLRNDKCQEESWVKLPDDSILSYDVWVDGPPWHAQRYVPATGLWVDAGNVPVTLSGSQSIEIGPAVLLPDGRVWFTGETGHTAFYDLAGNSWTVGPDLPIYGSEQTLANDDPGAVLSNGHVLIAVDNWSYTQRYLLDFDPATNTYTDVTPSSDIIDTSGFVVFDRMLVLPNGQVLLTTGSNQLAVYTPDGAPDPSWAPTIAGITANGDGSYTLRGTQLNGLDEGAAYGDDAQMASNYPIVRLSDDSGNVFYARTFNWSSTGVATGAQEVSTVFQLPADLPDGHYLLSVVANGIASEPADFEVGPGSPPLIPIGSPTSLDGIPSGQAPPFVSGSSAAVAADLAPWRMDLETPTNRFRIQDSEVGATDVLAASRASRFPPRPCLMIAGMVGSNVEAVDAVFAHAGLAPEP